MTHLIKPLALVLLLVARPVFAQDDKFLVAGGIRVRYLESGTGEAIMLMHGAGGRAEDWLQSGVFQNLATKYRVIAYDQRGNGLSDKPRQAEQYGAEIALDAVRLLDHLGIRRAHFVGYSAGANLLGKLLTLHPERIISATLGGGAGRFDWTDKTPLSMNRSLRSASANVSAEHLSIALRQ